jgi:hypothetical protein
MRFAVPTGVLHPHQQQRFIGSHGVQSRLEETPPGGGLTSPIDHSLRSRLAPWRYDRTIQCLFVGKYSVLDAQEIVVTVTPVILGVVDDFSQLWRVLAQ